MIYQIFSQTSRYIFRKNANPQFIGVLSKAIHLRCIWAPLDTLFLAIGMFAITFSHLKRCPNENDQLTSLNHSNILQVLYFVAKCQFHRYRIACD